MHRWHGILGKPVRCGARPRGDHAVGRIHRQGSQMPRTPLLPVFLAVMILGADVHSQETGRVLDDILRSSVQSAQGVTVEVLQLTVPGRAARVQSNPDDLATLFSILLGGDSTGMDAAAGTIPLTLSQRYNNQIELSGSLPAHLAAVTLELVALHRLPLILAGLDSNGEALAIEPRIHSLDDDQSVRRPGERRRSRTTWNISHLSIGQNDIRIFVLGQDNVARQVIHISLHRGASTPSSTPAAAAVPLPTGNTDPIPQNRNMVSLNRDDWRQIQISLIQAGFDPGTPDGIPGPRTRSAIRDWQRANGLPPNGELDASSSRILLSPGFPSQPR